MKSNWLNQTNLKNTSPSLWHIPLPYIFHWNFKKFKVEFWVPRQPMICPAYSSCWSQRWCRRYLVGRWNGGDTAGCWWNHSRSWLHRSMTWIFYNTNSHKSWTVGTFFHFVLVLHQHDKIFSSNIHKVSQVEANTFSLISCCFLQTPIA